MLPVHTTLYVRFGGVSTSRKAWELGMSQQAEVTDAEEGFSKRPAWRLLPDAGQPNAVVQLLTCARNGVAAIDATPPLPLSSLKSLLKQPTSDAVNASLELYGYWLGCGSEDVDAVNTFCVPISHLLSDCSLTEASPAR